MQKKFRLSDIAQRRYPHHRSSYQKAHLYILTSHYNVPCGWGVLPGVVLHLSTASAACRNNRGKYPDCEEVCALEFRPALIGRFP